MHRLKLVGVMIGALFSLAITASAASAFTLPDLSLTLSGTYPVRALGSLSSARVTFGTASGLLLEGTGITLLLTGTSLSPEGEVALTLTNVKLPGTTEQCETEGDPPGVVTVIQRSHIVPVNSMGRIARLYLVETWLVSCGVTIDYEFKSGYLLSINAGTENQELTTFGGAILGTKGKPNISEYINDAGSTVKVKLEVEVNKSGEDVAADENVEASEIPLTVLGSKMIVITGR